MYETTPYSVVNYCKIKKIIIIKRANKQDTRKKTKIERTSRLLDTDDRGD